MVSQSSPTPYEETPVELAGVEVLPTRAPRRTAAVEKFPTPAPAPVEPIPERPSAISVDAPISMPQGGLAARDPRIIRRQEAVLDMFTALSRVLATRFLLFLALIGAFVLALQAMGNQTTPGLAVLISYCLLIVGPLVWLETRKQGARG